MSTKASLILAGAVVALILAGVSLRGSPLEEQVAIYTLAPIGRVLGGMRNINCGVIETVSVTQDSRGKLTTTYHVYGGHTVVDRGCSPLPGARPGMTVMQSTDYFGRTTTQLYR